MRINEVLGDTPAVENIEVIVELRGEIGSGLCQIFQEHT